MTAIVNAAVLPLLAAIAELRVVFATIPPRAPSQPEEAKPLLAPPMKAPIDTTRADSGTQTCVDVEHDARSFSCSQHFSLIAAVGGERPVPMPMHGESQTDALPLAPRVEVVEHGTDPVTCSLSFFIASVVDVPPVTAPSTPAHNKKSSKGNATQTAKTATRSQATTTHVQVSDATCQCTRLEPSEELEEDRMHWDDLMRTFLNDFRTDPGLGYSIALEMDSRVEDCTSVGSRSFALALSKMARAAAFAMVASQAEREGSKFDTTPYWVERLSTEWSSFRAMYPPSESEDSEPECAYGNEDEEDDDDDDARAMTHMSNKACSHIDKDPDPTSC